MFEVVSVLLSYGGLLRWDMETFALDFPKIVFTVVWKSRIYMQNLKFVPFEIFATLWPHHKINLNLTHNRPSNALLLTSNSINISVSYAKKNFNLNPYKYNYVCCYDK